MALGFHDRAQWAQTDGRESSATESTSLGSSRVLSVELPPEPTSAGRARVLARERLGAVCTPDVLDTIVLLVTELVTNAVLHAGTPLHLTIETTTEHVRLCVADSSRQIPEANGYDSDAVSGRGLSLVERLASTWGVDQTPSGKIVWCEIPI